MTQPVRISSPETVERGKAYKRERRREIALFLRAYKSGTPCTDCGNYFPEYVMEFDHVPERGQRRHDIGSQSSGSWGTLMEEMDMCDLVCANCHKVRSHVRGQFGRIEDEGDDQTGGS
jgi:hypothetical protein